jgi:hypothetical protein
MTIVIPAAMMAVIEICSETLRRFSGVKKNGDITPKRTNSRINASPTPNRSRIIFIGAIN